VGIYEYHKVISLDPAKNKEFIKVLEEFASNNKGTMLYGFV
jgi:hypothetical protein